MRRQQSTTKGAIARSPQLELTGDQVHAQLAAGEQVELFVGLDQLIGVEGPGGARHGGS
ncbi:hypothetical protein D9M72_597300 [compost metagenome]